MSNVLDGLKERLETAKSRLALAQQRHQAASAELNAATAEYNVWGAAVSIEANEQERLAADAREKQMPLPEMPIQSRPVIARATLTITAPIVEGQGESASAPNSVNKTDLVRELLGHRRMAMTPDEIWKALEGQIASRAYLYSILKRLRDKDEIRKWRNRYSLKPKPVEVKAETEATLLQ
jgi:hypothetical protein